MKKILDRSGEISAEVRQLVNYEIEDLQQQAKMNMDESENPVTSNEVMDVLYNNNDIDIDGEGRYELIHYIVSKL